MLVIDVSKMGQCGTGFTVYQEPVYNPTPNNTVSRLYETVMTLIYNQILIIHIHAFIYTLQTSSY